MDAIEKNILAQVADLHKVPEGAYNIRYNGKLDGRNSTANIEITNKEDGSGIDIRIKSGTKNESVHIPVVISATGLKDVVKNDFFVGDDCDVVIVAGCGIHNCGDQTAQHDGLHRFYIGKNSHVKYVEKHYGEGEGTGERVMNPKTEVYQQENSSVEMEMIQIKGIDDTKRDTVAHLEAGAKLIVKERLLTDGKQFAESTYDVYLDGEDSSANIISRSVAKGESKQRYLSRVSGNAKCSGHTECDAIIVGQGKIDAIPELAANHPDAALIHEAAIGKIAGEQIIKLQTLGLTEQEAETQIINGFLK